MVLFWIGFGIVFLIVELITATFYGFSLAIAAFIVAIYAAIMNSSNVDIIQGAIFAGTALVTCYFFPKFFALKETIHLFDEKILKKFYLKCQKRVFSKKEVL